MYRVKYWFFDGKCEPEVEMRYINDDRVNEFISMIREKGFVGSMNRKGGYFTAKVNPGDFDHHGDYCYFITINRYREPRPMTKGEMEAFIPTIKDEYTIQLEPGYYYWGDDDTDGPIEDIEAANNIL